MLAGRVDAKVERDAMKTTFTCLYGWFECVSDGVLVGVCVNEGVERVAGNSADWRARQAVKRPGSELRNVLV